MRAEIIAVGSELLTPSRLDTNSLFITAQLNGLGIRVARKFVVGDDADEIRDAFLTALTASDIVIMTGGLGPTNDDITREVVAQALDLELIPDPAVLEQLMQRYRRLGVEMTDNTRRQAMVPQGAEIMSNPKGTAPGLFLERDDRLIFLIPGPPRELESMVLNQVLPCIRQSKPTAHQYCRQLKVASMAESKVDALISPIYSSCPEIETTILSSPGIIELSFQWCSPVSRNAEENLADLVKRVRETLGESVFTDQNESLEEVVGKLLKSRGLTLASAESCTGGLVGEMVTRTPGSSEYYLGGVVCYSNDLKSRLVGVDTATLQKFGAVSAEVAEELASGICRRVGSDIGLSVTGIAGPSGGSEKKPVGLVYIGLSTREGSSRVKELQFSGDRETIRLRSARFALDWLRTQLS
ncbi:MAG: competence/damage-inducible protein A [Acidobacteriota bacterium]